MLGGNSYLALCECVCVCVCMCGGIHSANLHMVSLKEHHNGLFLCGVANGSSPGLSRVVEIRQGQDASELALQANKRDIYVFTSCSIKRTKEQRVLWTMLLSLAHLQSHGPPGQNFKASNWLFSVPWPGRWKYGVRVWIRRGRIKIRMCVRTRVCVLCKGTCMRVCIYTN